MLYPRLICHTTVQPDMQSKLQKEGAESEQFWEILGGKSEYPSEKIGRDAESDPHLFSCTFSKGRVLTFLLCSFLPKILVLKKNSILCFFDFNSSTNLVFFTSPFLG